MDMKRFGRGRSGDSNDVESCGEEVEPYFGANMCMTHRTNGSISCREDDSVWGGLYLTFGPDESLWERPENIPSSHMDTVFDIDNQYGNEYGILPSWLNQNEFLPKPVVQGETSGGNSTDRKAKQATENRKRDEGIFKKHEMVMENTAVVEEQLLEQGIPGLSSARKPKTKCHRNNFLNDIGCKAKMQRSLDRTSRRSGSSIDQDEPLTRVRSNESEIIVPGNCSAIIDPETEPQTPLYQEFLKSDGSLSIEPLYIRLRLSKSLAKELKQTKLRDQVQVKLMKGFKDEEVEYVDSGKPVKFRPRVEDLRLEKEGGKAVLLVTIRRKGPISNPSQSLPLSGNHGKFPFYFQFEFWIDNSLVETVTSQSIYIYSKEPKETKRKKC